MISRLMLSLKKASRAGENGWTTNTLSRAHPRAITQMAFGDPPIGPEDSDVTTPDEVALSLSELSDGQIGGRSGEGLYDNRYRAGFELWAGETCSGSGTATTVIPPPEA